jgi:hypothetical protein
VETSDIAGMEEPEFKVNLLGRTNMKVGPLNARKVSQLDTN